MNQLLFATTLLRDLLESKWFAATNFRDQDVDYFKTNTAEAFRTSSWREIRYLG